MSTAWAVHVCIYANRMSVALFLPSVIEIFQISIFRIKARNAFLTQGFLPSDAAKIVQGEQEAKFI